MIFSNDLDLLKVLSPKAFAFIQGNDLKSLSCGRYELGDNDYVNISVDSIRDRDDALYESHQHYADLHYCIDGRESVELADRATLGEPSKSDIDGDVFFYADNRSGRRFSLTTGDFLYAGRDDAHMPLLGSPGESAVKKAVFKLSLHDKRSAYHGETIKMHPSVHKIKLLVMDVDGTMTDGKIVFAESGEVQKNFNVKDGYGISTILKEKDINPVVMTGRSSDILASRCSELGVDHLYQGVKNKTSALKKMIADQLFPGVTLGEVAYIGDDSNDLDCMEAVLAEGGVVGCPADAVADVVGIATFVSTKRGGEGAVREFIDWL